MLPYKVIIEVLGHPFHLTRGGSVVEFFSGGLKNNQLLNAIPTESVIRRSASNEAISRKYKIKKG